MVREAAIEVINVEFAAYIRDIRRGQASADDIDKIKEDLRDILAKYELLVAPV